MHKEAFARILRNASGGTIVSGTAGSSRDVDGEVVSFLGEPDGESQNIATGLECLRVDPDCAVLQKRIQEISKARAAKSKESAAQETEDKGKGAGEAESKGKASGVRPGDVDKDDQVTDVS